MTAPSVSGVFVSPPVRAGSYRPGRDPTPRAPDAEEGRPRLHAPPALRSCGPVARRAPTRRATSVSYFAFARLALTKSQLTSLSKKVCTQTGRRFW